MQPHTTIIVPSLCNTYCPSCTAYTDSVLSSALKGKIGTLLEVVSTVCVLGFLGGWGTEQALHVAWATVQLEVLPA